MKISVVIPAYNAEQTIGRAINSVLTQTRQADEIIISIDLCYPIGGRELKTGKGEFLLNEARAIDGPSQHIGTAVAEVVVKG